jgi:hypothetical protein
MSSSLSEPLSSSSMLFDTISKNNYNNDSILLDSNTLVSYSYVNYVSYLLLTILVLLLCIRYSYTSQQNPR